MLERLTPFFYYLSSTHHRKHRRHDIISRINVYFSHDKENKFIDCIYDIYSYNTDENTDEKILSYIKRKIERLSQAGYFFLFTKPPILLRVCFENMHYYDTDDEKEEEEEQINATKSFKSDECVICLTNSPNILFCNCGHIPICGECEEMKPLNICPVCKTSNSIKRVIE